MSIIEIKEVTADRRLICNGVLRALPLWIGIESAIRQYVLGVENLQMFVAYDGIRPIGFLSLRAPAAGTLPERGDGYTLSVVRDAKTEIPGI